MLFDRLLRRRPAGDRRASPTELAELALGHPDASSRLDAVRRLASLSALRGIVADSGDVQVREIAMARYRNLLCGSEQAGIRLDERLSELGEATDPRAIEQVATEAPEPELRRAAIGRTVSPAVLVSCVLHDPLAANRSAALALITDRPSLEQIARGIRKKDKVVYRETRERLRRLAEEEAVPARIEAQCAELCERIQRLGRLEQWSQDHALLEHLDSQWAELQPQASPQWRDLYAQERTRFLEAFEAHRDAAQAEIAAREARAAARGTREALIEQARGLAAIETERELASAREQLAAQWAELALLPPADEAPYAKRFTAALSAIDHRLADLGERRRTARRLTQLIAAAGRLLDESHPLEAARVRELIAQGREMADALGDEALARDYSSRADALRKRLESQGQRARERLAQLPDSLTALEAALDAGELKQADPLRQSIEAGLGLIQSSGLTGTDPESVRARFRALAPRLKELQQWRRWGADQHREALCEAMEGLCADPMPLPAVAERLHVLQMDWKQLDQSGSPGNRALWERFHAAAESVYERVRPVLDAEAAERQANREAREQLCAQVEGFVEQVDWTRVDWKRVQRAAREMHQGWRAIGPCEARYQRALGRRFHRAMTRLEGRIDEERARNRALREGLIERARALADAPDVGAAIEEARTLRRDWYTTVAGRKGEENQLWRDFRSACDAVFERRASVQRAAQAELEANLAARLGLCAEAEALAAGDCAPGRLVELTQALERRWRDTEVLPVPRQAVGALSRRWREARAKIEAWRQLLESQRRSRLIDQAAAHGALCAELEHHALSAGEKSASFDAETAAARRSALPDIDDPEVSAALQARFDTALAACTDPARRDTLLKAIPENDARRRRLCLEIEIAAGVASPAESAQERLALQVSRLAGHMVAGEDDSLRDTDALMIGWHTCGPTTPDPRLDTRVAHARKALGGSPFAGPGAEPAPASPHGIGSSGGQDPC
jgi:hypothetical protein